MSKQPEPTKPLTEREKQLQQRQIEQTRQELIHRHGGKGQCSGKIKFFR